MPDSRTALRTLIMTFTDGPFFPTPDPDPNPAQAILDGKYPVPRGISSEGRDLVRRLFAKRADDRISIAQIKRHPWFLQNLPEELSVRVI